MQAYFSIKTILNFRIIQVFIHKLQILNLNSLSASVPWKKKKSFFSAHFSFSYMCIIEIANRVAVIVFYWAGADCLLEWYPWLGKHFHVLL